MSGQGLQVLAAAFEQCQGTVSTRAASIVELGGELRRLQSVLGSEDVGGDQCGQLAAQVSTLSSGLEALGGSSGVGGVADGIRQILEKFHQVDIAQAANPHLAVRPSRCSQPRSPRLVRLAFPLSSPRSATRRR